MQKKFITNLALLLLLNLLIKPFWILGIDREVQVITGADEYGLYYALFNFSFLLNALLDLGITNYNNRNIAQNENLLTSQFSNIVGVKIILAGFYLVLTLIAAVILGYRGEAFYMLLVLGFNQILISFVLYLRSNISGLHYFKTDSIISVLDRIIMIIISLILLSGNITGGEYKIEWFIYTQTAGYAGTAIIAFFIVLQKAGKFKLFWNPSFYITILKKSWPFALLILLMMLYSRSDTVLMERLLKDRAVQTGIYAQAFRILDAANMIGFLFAGLLLPLFSRMIKLNEKINELVSLSLSFILVVAVISSSVSYFYSMEIMDLLYKEHIEESADIFRVLMISFVFISIIHIFGTLLTANGNLKLLNQIAGLGVTLNILSNLYIIPEYKAYGAAVVGLLTNVLIAGLQIIFAVTVFKLKKTPTLALRILIFSAGTFLFGYLSLSLPFGWMANLLIMAVGSMIWAFLAGMINLKSIYLILKEG
jgi:O-antigen/teichoic acid export membrane protein